MTIKKLYEMAKAKGLENAPLTIDYQCSDWYYNYYGDIYEEDIRFTGDEKKKKKVCITIEN